MDESKAELAFREYTQNGGKCIKTKMDFVKSLFLGKYKHKATHWFMSIHQRAKVS